jgi:hypothetical protein
MSILATLALLMFAKRDDRDDLAIELKQARDEIETLQAERDALAVEVARQWRIIDGLRARSLQNLATQQMQAQNMAMAQYAQQAGMQNLYPHRGWGQSQSMLGAQQLDPERFCNCVPARHDVFIRGT